MCLYFIYKIQKKIVRRWLLVDKKRVDGRTMNQIRPLGAEVGLLPRTHGSGLFTRGQTQVLTVATLGSLSEAQMLDGIDNETSKTTRLQDYKLVDSLSCGLVDFNIGYPYNPKKAEQLLKDNALVGYELKLYTTQDYIDIAKFVQSALTEVGLNCKVEEMMPAALREKRANGNLPFFRSSWVADYPDAENYLSLFTTNNFTPQGPNYTHYSNEKFDELYKKSLTCNDLQERAKIYHEMDSLMMAEAPVVILFYDEVLRFVNKNVEGLGSNPTNMLDLKRVKVNS